MMQRSLTAKLWKFYSIVCQLVEGLVEVSSRGYAPDKDRLLAVYPVI
jgi:hypothetical protein